MKTKPMALREYYKKATLYPSIVILLVTTVFSIIDNYNYKSEWLTPDAVIFLIIVTTFVYCLIISLLSITIFLNKIPKIKNNIILNFLTWFLLPFGVIIPALVYQIKYKIRYDEDFGNDFKYVVILNLPFIIGLIWTYYEYRNQSRRLQEEI